MKFLYVLCLIASTPFVIAETTESYSTTGSTEIYTTTESSSKTEIFSTTESNIATESQSSTEAIKTDGNNSSYSTTEPISGSESHSTSESITAENQSTTEAIKAAANYSTTELVKGTENESITIESQSTTEAIKTYANHSAAEPIKGTESHSLSDSIKTEYRGTNETFGSHFTTQLIGHSTDNKNADLTANILKSILDLEDVAFMNVTEKCEQDFRRFVQSLIDFKPWALQMFDSMAKFPANLMELVNYNFGNFDECISTKIPEGNMKGQYCLMYMFRQINRTIEGQPEILQMVSKKFDENIKAFPGNGFYMGTCIPASCSPHDWTYIFNNVLEKGKMPLNGVTDSRACSTEEKDPLNGGDWAVVGVLSFFMVLVILSTTYDVLNRQSARRNELYLAFSVLTNGKKLISTSASDDSFDCLHGIRFLTMAWITLDHTWMTNICMAPSINKKEAYETWKNPDRMYLSAGTLSVDVFLLLSGFLVSYSVLKQVRNMTKIMDFNIPLFYLYRIIRITSPMAIVVILQMTLMMHVGDGPGWKLNMSISRDTCIKQWWPTLLHIQNYYDPQKLCLDQLWYVAVDTQLYVLSPIVLIPLWRKPKLGLLLVFTFFVLGCVSCFTVAYHYELTPSYITAKPAVYKNFINNYFYATHTRYGPWIVGIFLGYVILKASEEKPRLSKIFVILGWLFFAALSLSCMYLANIMYQPDYVYNIWECSFYIAFYRVGFAIGIAWIIYACILGYGGPANKILSLKVWFPLSRLSYCIYLVQMSVIYSRTFSLHTHPYVDVLNMFSDFFGNLAICIMAAIPLSLIFEAPSITLGKLLIGAKKMTKTVVPINPHGQRTG